MRAELRNLLLQKPLPGEVRVWTSRRGGEKTWEARLTLEDLESVTERFIELILEQRP